MHEGGRTFPSLQRGKKGMGGKKNEKRNESRKRKTCFFLKREGGGEERSMREACARGEWDFIFAENWQETQGKKCKKKDRTFHFSQGEQFRSAKGAEYYNN